MTTQTINWFPGHMVAARREALKEMAHIDVVVEVLDARCPNASCNPMIIEMRNERQRPSLKVLNKADVADPQITARWLEYLNAQPKTMAIALSSKKPSDVLAIVPAAQKLAPHRNEFSKPLRLMAMGVPNVGKSTLINALLKRRSASVGDEPAITKVVRRYNLTDSSWLIDTPGLMWPKIEDPNAASMLASCHTLGVNAYFDDDVALYLADELRRKYPKLLDARYDIDSENLTDLEVIESIAMNRGYKLRGSKPDFGKAAKALHLDFRSGLIGRISLEEPPAIAA
jgi:ribosome biogenesis GTPase A